MSFMSEASWEHSYVALLLCLKTEPRIKNGTKIPPENIFVANSYLFYHSRALCNKANLLLNGQKPSSHWKNGEKIEKSRNRQVEILILKTFGHGCRCNSKPILSRFLYNSCFFTAVLFVLLRYLMCIASVPIVWLMHRH